MLLKENTWGKTQIYTRSFHLAFDSKVIRISDYNQVKNNLGV